MKRFLSILLVVLFTTLLVNGAYAGNWGSKLGGSRATAATDTLIGTAVDTILHTISADKKSILGVYLSLDDLATNTVSDSVHIKIYGSAVPIAKTGAWALLQTHNFVIDTTLALVGNIGYVYMPDNATYIYNAPYLQARVYQSAGTAADDSVGYRFYWIYQKD